MQKYKHAVQYYETDKMGITHHSNYIRWMEEARTDFLKRIGWDYSKLENMGVISPVIEVNCKYKNSTTYGDEVFIDVTVQNLKELKVTIHYEMHKTDGTLVAVADSTHCFLNKQGKPIKISKDFPDFYMALNDLCVKDFNK